MTTLVTGATGFIGRRVVDALESAGASVTRWSAPIDEQFDADAVDVLVHLASRARHTAEDDDVERECDAMRAVLAFCERTSARLVFASTAGVYASRAPAPQREDAELGPVSPYGAAKLACERLCVEAYERHRTAVTILRLFNVYGPGQRPPFLIPSIVEALAADQVLSLKMPEAIRDFVFVDDVVRAVVAAARGDAADAGVVNVGSGRGARVAEVVGRIADLLGRPARWQAARTAVVEVSSSVADIGRARDLLGWTPRVTLETGLAAVCRSAATRVATE